MRSAEEIDLVVDLVRHGLNDCEVARRTGIPRTTVRDWRQGKRKQRDTSCENHDFSFANSNEYAYLLGLYLGDGDICRVGRSWRLRITLDGIYPGIIGECVAAMASVTPGKVNIQRRRDSRATAVLNYWKHWPCLFPQHGPGRKHLRPIMLDAWQQTIVAARPEPFIRGLIHSDGTRIIATERKGNYVRRAPRYAFSNRSEDILQLFQAACDALGVHTTRASVKQIAVYSKAAVARLDEFVGPKA